jgi:hypothetical protein
MQYGKQPFRAWLQRKPLLAMVRTKRCGRAYPFLTSAHTREDYINDINDLRANCV